MKNIFIIILVLFVGGVINFYNDLKMDYDEQLLQVGLLEDQKAKLENKNKELAKIITDYEAEIVKQKDLIAEQQEDVKKINQQYLIEKEKQKIQTEYVYKTVEKIIEKPVYKNICIDQEGLDELNKLIP